MICELHLNKAVKENIKPGPHRERKHVNNWKQEELKSGTTWAEGEPHSTESFRLGLSFHLELSLSLGTCLGLGGWERGTYRSRKTASNN